MRQLAFGHVAHLAARVAELVLQLTAHEHDGRDHGKRDERNEKDVFDHAGTTLGLGEPGLEPCPHHEQVHRIAPCCVLAPQKHRRDPPET